MRVYFKDYAPYKKEGKKSFYLELNPMETIDRD